MHYYADVMLKWYVGTDGLDLPKKDGKDRKRKILYYDGRLGDGFEMGLTAGLFGGILARKAGR